MSKYLPVAAFWIYSLLPSQVIAQSNVWTAVYWAEWSHWVDGDGYNAEGRSLPADSVDWSAINLLLHTNVEVDDPEKPTISGNGFTSTRIADIVQHAHAQIGPPHDPVPVVVSLGGYFDFNLIFAISDAGVRTTLIENMLAFMEENEYDGWDIDLERGSHGGNGFNVANPNDTTNFKLFMNQLRDSLNTKWAYWDPNQRPLLTSWYPMWWNGREVYSGLMPILDKMLIGTYDFADTWLGYVWHASNLRDSSLTDPNNSNPVPSAAHYVSQ
jgi:GH18 family chitinase